MTPNSKAFLWMLILLISLGVAISLAIQNQAVSHSHVVVPK